MQLKATAAQIRFGSVSCQEDTSHGCLQSNMLQYEPAGILSFVLISHTLSVGTLVPSFAQCTKMSRQYIKHNINHLE
jgi:hypothetical protein